MTPWPDDAYDCALRLAHSLGYREINIFAKDGRVYVNYPTWSDKWRELDPRNPTVWVALIGPPGVKKLKYQSFDFFTVIYDGGKRGAPAIEADYVATCGDGLKGTHKDIGIAVCEAYNALKGNPRRGNE